MWWKSLHVKYFILALVTLPLSASSTFAATLNVRPGDYQTIQAAIDAAVDGDTVLVADGTYKGDGNKNLDFKAKAITLQCENGPEHCIIDCENDGRGFYFHSGEGETSMVTGFTIQNGLSFGTAGAGIWISYSSPLIRNNVITNNQGSGIGINGVTNARLENNVLIQNSGGISLFGGEPTIRGNIIKQNRGPGIYSVNTNALKIISNVIAGNEGNGIEVLIPGGLSGTDVQIVNNTIIQNLGNGASGNRDPFLKVLNNIVAGNRDCGIFLDTSYDWGAPTSNYNDTWDNGGGSYCGLALAGPNDISSDPMFVDSPSGNYHLWPGSPCVDAGTDAWAPGVDFEGQLRPIDGNGDGLAVTDIGADEAGLLKDHDVAPQAMHPAQIDIEPGVPFLPGAKVRNIGTSQESGFPVRCEIHLGSTQVYSDAKVIAGLTSLASLDLSFAQWTPQAEGTYTMRFSTQLTGDENAANDVQTRTIRVTSLKAAFSSDVTFGDFPLEVRFEDLSVGLTAGWLWDFGDGQTSTEKNPSHTYTRSGSYNVSLTVTSPNLTDTETKVSCIVVLPDVFAMEQGNAWSFQGSQQGNPYTMEQKVIPIPRETYDATGTWSYSLTNGWVNPGNAGCIPVYQSGSAYVTQIGKSVTMFIDGGMYAGNVNGAVYTFSTSYPLQGGTMTENLSFTASSDVSASGTLTWSWAGGGYWCNGGNVLSVTRPSGQTDFQEGLQIVESKRNGVLEGLEWYKTGQGELRYWGFQSSEQGVYYNFRFTDGLLAAWYPMAVGDRRVSSTTVAGSFSVNVSLAVDVVAKEGISLDFGTVETYKLRYELRTWGGGVDETEIFYQWVVPYLGVVKSEGSPGIETLTSFAVAGGVITQNTDADEDNLRDFEELARYRTNWQNPDTDGDTCQDGVEVAGGRNPNVVDPQGDLNKDCAVDLRDAILGLQLLAGMEGSTSVFLESDVNGDGKLGLPEVLYALQKVAGLR